MLGLATLAVLLCASVAQAASSVYTTRGSFPGRIYSLAVGVDGGVSLRSPEFVSAANGTSGVGVTPDGLNLYATNPSTTTLNQYSVSPLGLLSPLATPSLAVSENDFAIAVSPDGSSLYTVAANPTEEIEMFTIGPGGGLVPKSPPKLVTEGRFDVVLSANGKYLYSSNFGGLGLIFQYEVEPGGTLKALSPPSVSTGAFPVGMAVTPDGRNLYAGTESSAGILQFTIGVDGTLAAMTPPNVTLPAETNSENLAVTPDGTNLYASDTFNGGISQFAIGPGGALSPLSPPKAVPGTDVNSIAVSPDGRSIYAGRLAPEEIQRFAIGPGGALTATSNELTAVGVPSQIAVSPDQGPTAALNLTLAAARRSSSFSAVGSSDPDGQVVRYDWSFGDGESATTTGPTTTHAYRRGGDYTASVTVTDNEGASTTRVFTGHQVLRNGGPAAQAAKTFHVAGSAPVLSNLKIKPKRFAVGVPGRKTLRAVKGPPRGAFLSFDLDTAGTVVERIQRKGIGHRHRGKCSAGAKTGKRCSTWKSLKGSARLTGKEGANRIVFTGRFQGKKLKPGIYRFVLTTEAEGVTDTTNHFVKFTILAR